jgi:hypothetical protein
VYVADGNAYFNRSGPRIVDSLELLAALLHPGRFPDQAARLAGAAMRIGPDLQVLPATHNLTGAGPTVRWVPAEAPTSSSQSPSIADQPDPDARGAADRVVVDHQVQAVEQPPQP